jgi:GntR family transcriptional repressor for pyruvate dehydrogenase complex
MALPVEPPLRAMETSAGRRVRLPRMAEVVADSLRASILSGELTVVPRLEDLIEQFNVGPPAVREAMRILETEGLVTVRRGNVGGADVHLPTDDRVSYMVSLVLQAKGTKLHDVGAALRELEPVCAAMCAQRPDRGEMIVPGLQALLAEQADAIGDRPRTMALTDRFHDLIVQGCGNDTMIIVVGSLERVWARHATAVYAEDGAEVAPAVWRASLRDHQRIADAIERGDPRVAELASRHLGATQAYMSAVDDAQLVNASTLHR